MWATLSQPALLVNAYRNHYLCHLFCHRPGDQPSEDVSNHNPPDVMTPSTAAETQTLDEETLGLGLQDKLRQWGPGHWRSPSFVCKSFQCGLIHVIDVGTVQSQPPRRPFAHHQLQSLSALLCTSSPRFRFLLRMKACAPVAVNTELALTNSAHRPTLNI